MRTIGPAIALAAAAAVPAAAQVLDPAAGSLEPVAAHVVGRGVAAPGGGMLRQWPGTYFETAFTGPAIWFRVGEGEVNLRVTIDGVAAPLTRPEPGMYRIDASGMGPHRVRIDVISESQAGPTTLGGFFATSGTRAVPMPPRARQIELIGDSHSVGYGNTSPTRECDDAAVWATTDTAQGIGGLLAKRYDADVQVNAISGRGVVRNYGGFAGDTLPQAYPFALFDKGERAADSEWQPDVFVIALGTNDFTTPLKAGEQWPDRAALHADVEARYAEFVNALRAAHPDAFLVLWSTDMADGEIEAEVRKVAERLKAGGERRIAFVPMRGLTLAGCHAHPSVADDRVIAGAVAAAIDAAGIWGE
ncbi:SGNH/GDSL hydrolase family protein [Sphingomonas japonica]|uniref:Lysophospholipase L1-like esterase n=1 Tax=Sphingomonas japonica TaxID=511662 RepID=A0ABX0U2F4_9SPHN|nr:SGNH/GDSL hydrolase family protein [Sphingomonas japonica]NIJ23899.1 lysophospholipase L1-like esterase [Sphingomonas japonica]